MTTQTQLWKMMVTEAALTATANEARSREFAMKRKGLMSQAGSYLTLAMARNTGMKVNAFCQPYAGSLTATEIGSF